MGSETLGGIYGDGTAGPADNALVSGRFRTCESAVDLEIGSCFGGFINTGEFVVKGCVSGAGWEDDMAAIGVCCINGVCGNCSIGCCCFGGTFGACCISCELVDDIFPGGGIN